MDTIWQSMLLRLAEHVQVIVPVLIAVGVLSLGPIGRALARRLSGGEARRGELDDLRQQVAELLERVDYSERLLTGLRSQIVPESARPAVPPPERCPITPA
jgi:hypothetical protein